MNQKTAEELLKKVIKDYNEISTEFDKTRKNEWEDFKKFLPFIKNNSSLLDLGCGNGRFYDFLKKNDKKVKYIGVDNSKNLIEKAHQNNKKAKFVYGDLLKIPAENNSQDIVVSIATFHHLPSRKLRIKALIEISRILKKDGILILTAWNLFQPKYKKYIWLSYLRHLLSLGKYDIRDTFIPWGKTGVKRYYYAFKESELEKILKTEFQIIEKYSGKNFTFTCKKK